MANSLQAQGELIDHALVVDGSLIVHAPGTASELQATLVDQLADDRLGSFGLLRPPFGEEGGLHLDEAARGSLISSAITVSMMYWTPACWMLLLWP